MTDNKQGFTNVADMTKDKATGMPVNSEELEKFVKERKQREEVAFTQIYERQKRRKFLHDGSIFDETGILKQRFDDYTDLTPAELTAKTKAQELAKRIGSGETGKFLLQGDPGRGKSYFSACILNELQDHAAKPLSCMYVSVTKLADMELNAVRSNSYQDQKAVNDAETRCRKVDVLVLDDIGTESVMQAPKYNAQGQPVNLKQASDFVQKWLYRIADSRKNKATIVTTNLTGKGIQAVYNAKIISRIIAKRPENVLTFNGISDHRD